MKGGKEGRKSEEREGERKREGVREGEEGESGKRAQDRKGEFQWGEGLSGSPHSLSKGAEGRGVYAGLGVQEPLAAKCKVLIQKRERESTLRFTS